MIWREIGEYQQPEYFPHAGKTVTFGYVSCTVEGCALLCPAVLTISKDQKQGILTIQGLGELRHDPMFGWIGVLNHSADLTAEACEMVKGLVKMETILKIR